MAATDRLSAHSRSAKTELVARTKPTLCEKVLTKEFVSWGCYWTFPTLLTSSMFFSLIPTERKQSQTFHHLPSLCAGCSLVTDASYLICANPKPLVNTCIQETKITIKSLWHSVCVCESKRERAENSSKSKKALFREGCRETTQYFFCKFKKKTFSILYLTELQFNYDRDS